MKIPIPDEVKAMVEDTKSSMNEMNDKLDEVIAVLKEIAVLLAT